MPKHLDYSLRTFRCVVFLVWHVVCSASAIRSPVPRPLRLACNCQKPLRHSIHDVLKRHVDQTGSQLYRHVTLLYITVLEVAGPIYEKSERCLGPLLRRLAEDRNFSELSRESFAITQNLATRLRLS